MKKVDLSTIKPFDMASVLLYSLPNAGKTHLMGQAAQYEVEHGGKPLYVVTDGEPSFNTLKGIGYTGEIVAVTSIDDCDEVVKQYAKAGLTLVVLDSLMGIVDFSFKAVTGGTRTPTLDKKGAKEWSEIKFQARRSINALKKLAPYFIAACHAMTTNQEGIGYVVNPAMIGQDAVLIAGRFDYVGFMETGRIGARVARLVHFERMNNTLTRWNGVNRLTKAIEIPDDVNGWELLRGYFTGELKEKK